MISSLLNGFITRFAVDLAERSAVPDTALRWAIRRLLRQRLAEAAARGEDGAQLAKRMRSLPIAVEQQEANEQHYEVPHAFFEATLGPRLKYSSCYFEDGEGTRELARAEERMLALTCERGRLADGMHVLDLGCGWGSLSLFIAEHYPACRVLAVSNSHSQRASIERTAKQRGFDNLRVITCDVSDFEPAESFDRAFSIEMFEHMRNWSTLFARVASWLEPDGLFFMHYFCHREYGYFYEDQGSGDWMARNFFSGGIMPSENLPAFFEDELRCVERWRVNGLHYSRTLEAWLERIDAAPERARNALESDDPERALQRWRMFMMACSELFAAENGEAWFVSHTLLAPQHHEVPTA